MPKKHNKKRNTAILYEILCKELTKALTEDDQKRAQKARSILEEYFSEGSILSEELDVYRDLYEAHDMPQRVAEKTLKEAKRTYMKFNDGDIYRQQSQVVNDINQDLGKDTFQNFVPNYKSLATIDQIFKNSELKPREKVLFEEKIMHEMRSPEKKEEEKKEPIDSLVFEKFTKKFNEKYGSELNEKQKDLLQKYILSQFEDAGADFKVHIDKEVGRLKEEMKNLQITSEEVREDKQLREKVNHVREILDEFSDKASMDKKDIKDVMRVQEVVNDLKGE